ncbi:inter-alpha-trypsin inhibitor heavy chain H3-like [Dreissena polymorpha]|uniref:Uncharacterized protein n=1 Tax=Dreissena polymorpha TaxID=45954 RepID=A0A9D4RIR0_DREPO|nr:inter-alpha-trypsin inhibitor heavy chain H3-like [Dreissena polymorpha]KAH3867750.1 hypothetical protein DPMN_030885 [Dreissena polymorpha]
MDFGFLSALSEENGANARRIFEGVSAKDQLVYFYDELSDIYLSRVSFNICSLDTRTEIKQVKVVTSRSEFPYFFGGSEIVMVGKMNAIQTESWGICVNAVSSTGGAIITISSSLVDSLPSGLSNEGRVDFIERIFAYKQIKYYLIMMDIARDESDAVKFKTLALNMSLEYNFVTPLTSMVVTQRLHDWSRLHLDAELDDSFSPLRKNVMVSPSYPVRAYSSNCGVGLKLEYLFRVSCLLCTIVVCFER